MFVCVCHAVSDQDIMEAVRSGAEDLSDVQAMLGAGTGCGTCQEFTANLIDQARADTLGYAA